MSRLGERHAWHRFLDTMTQRLAEFDGQVPVALLILSACQGCDEHPPRDDEEIAVHPGGAISVLCLPGFSDAETADLFEHVAHGIREGTIRCR